MMPRIDIFPRTMDAGNVYEGVRVDVEFKVVNIGDDTLRIEEIGTTCKCVAAILNQDFAYGEDTIRILASLNTEHRKGAVTEEIMVRSNDPYEPIIRLKINAHVIPAPEPEIKTEIFPLTNLYLGEVKNVPLVVENIGEAPLIILDATPSPSIEVLSQLPITIPQKEKATLSLEIKPVKVGILDETIRLSTNIREAPIHSVHVIGVVEEIPFKLKKQGDTLYIINDGKNLIAIQKIPNQDSLLLAPQETLMIYYPR